MIILENVQLIVQVHYMEILLISYVKLVMINVHYVLGLLSLNVKHVQLMDIIMMVHQLVKNVIQLVLNVQVHKIQTVKHVQKLDISLKAHQLAKHVIQLVKNVQEL